LTNYLAKNGIGKEDEAQKTELCLSVVSIFETKYSFQGNFAAKQVIFK
jgi:hypothetical protein